MKVTIIAIVATVMCASLLGSVSAQTPDGQTPAVETVCDPLRADNISKGLYGLCVAFCEAQDFADPEILTTPSDPDMLETDAPSGRILANYNKKKADTDPPMPCIVVEEPCPCWSTEELNSIDGINANDGSAMLLNCGLRSNTTPGLSDELDIIETDPTSTTTVFHWATARDRHNENDTRERCIYINNQTNPVTFRFLTAGAGTITHAQAVSCLAQVTARCDAVGL